MVKGPDNWRPVAPRIDPRSGVHTYGDQLGIAGKDFSIHVSASKGIGGVGWKSPRVLQNDKGEFFVGSEVAIAHLTVEGPGPEVSVHAPEVTIAGAKQGAIVVFDRTPVRLLSASDVGTKVRFLERRKVNVADAVIRAGAVLEAQGNVGKLDIAGTEQYPHDVTQEHPSRANVRGTISHLVPYGNTITNAHEVTLVSREKSGVMNGVDVVTTTRPIKERNISYYEPRENLVLRRRTV